MENESTSPEPTHAGSTLPTIRHDGWTGEKMAIFCETLAETAIVAEACEAARMGISGAYAARRRSPVFAAAWDAALSIARERLADTLLARSMKGNVEQIYKDGELVGERHFLDNRLGLQILRRLDRLASEFPAAGRVPGASKQRSHAALDPGLRRDTMDWNLAVDALRTGDDEGVARALALVESHEVEEVEGDQNLPLRDEDDEALDLTDRCWKDGVEDIWMTDFPPPDDFTGYESRPYDDTDDEERYVRICTADEVEILEADRARVRAGERAEDEDLRDRWFALLREEAETELAGGTAVAHPPSD
jgi:hypothetical protein